MGEVEYELQRFDQSHVFHRIRLFNLLIRGVLLRMPADIHTYVLGKVVFIDQLLDIDIRIVCCEEDYSGYQKLVIPTIILQLVASLFFVSQINEYPSCIRFEEQCIGQASERIS